MKTRLLVRMIACSLLAGLLCTAGCSRAKKDAAEAALAASTEAYTAMHEDASKYAPSESARVEKSIQSARNHLAKHDYSTALALANDIPSQIQELSASVKERKDELTEQWEDLSATVPALIRAAERHIDSLNRAHTSTTSPREMLGEARKQWQSANASFTGDDLLTAVAKAKQAKDTLSDFQQDREAEP